MVRNRFYHEVYDLQDAPSDPPYGWIQWKGTQVCIDLHCVCGTHGHVDAEFAYNLRCMDCGRTYAMGQVVKLIELTPEQTKEVEERSTSIIEFKETEG